MVEEPEISIPTEEPRHCPVCGARVAAMATSCLMCGASLEEEEEPEEEEEVRTGRPGWVRAVGAVGLALAILLAGGFGLYALMNRAGQEPAQPTLTPSATPTPAPSPTPSSTPTITPTPTPIPPLVHQVEQGDTLSTIAAAYDVAVESILALNPDVDPELIREGQLLLIPAAPPTPEPTNTPDPSVPTPTPADVIIHIVAPGETLGTIAEEYGISLALLREVNDLPPDDDTIFVNQSLVVPLGTPMPSPTPTLDPNATPTPIPPYPSPPLLSPADGAVLGEDGESVLLQWASVSVLRDNEWYALSFSQVPGAVVSETIYSRASAWRVPLDLLVTAEPETREFRWQVQVVRETTGEEGQVLYEEAGAPSEVRTFTWVGPTPTPGGSLAE